MRFNFSLLHTVLRFYDKERILEEMPLHTGSHSRLHSSIRSDVKKEVQFSAFMKLKKQNVKLKYIIQAGTATTENERTAMSYKITVSVY